MNSGWMELTNLNDQVDEYRRVIKLADGEILNRYWSDTNIPRSESYREDVKTAEEAVAKIPGTDKNDVYRNLRATAESGWDFSSRWLSVDNNNKWELYTIHTTDIIPVDLNSLLYNMEMVLSDSYKITGNNKRAEYYKSIAEARKNAMMKYLWNSDKGFFMDYNFRSKEHTPVISVAGVYPLFFRIASDKQAKAVSEIIDKNFLKPGGVIPTLFDTGQQWDIPNGWAPLQWIVITGLRNYNFDDMATRIKDRWLHLEQERLPGNI